MKRITAHEVVEAYRSMVIIPVRQAFFTKHGCCGLSAVCLFNKPGFAISAAAVRQWATEVYGWDYRVGFQMGWDRMRDAMSTDGIRQGYEDGKAAAEACGL